MKVNSVMPLVLVKFYAFKICQSVKTRKRCFYYYVFKLSLEQEQLFLSAVLFSPTSGR